MFFSARVGLTLLVTLAPLLAHGQRSFTAAQLDTLTIDHAYHCDYSRGKFRQYAPADEEKLQLLFLDCTVDSDSLHISGRLLEGGPGELFVTTTTDTACDLDKIGETDAKGAFTVTVVADRARSLYFMCEAHQDLEIKLRKLMGR